jgi:hypothetical protein
VITNTGKNILAKYLIGQAPAYASFVAIGIGPRPLSVGETFPDFSEQEQLEFEVLRTPITSRGFVYDEEGKPNIVFLAEIPGEQRYAITEIGIYPGRANPSAENIDSRIIYTFSEAENWEYHTQSSSVGLETIVAPLNLDEAGGNIAVTNEAFRTNSNNTIFSSPLRLSVFERPRFLNRTLMIRGDMSFLVESQGKLSVFESEGAYFGSHLHYNGISLDLDQVSPEDELRLAFSLLSKEEVQVGTTPAGTIRLLIEFANADVDVPTTFARFEVILNQSDEGVNFTANRYFVIKKKISELTKSPNFTWSAVNSVRIYTTVIESGGTTPSENFYISLDGLRFENVTTKNPLYGLTGYSVIKTLDGRPVVKESNTSNSIEFRFGLDVD